MDALAKIMADVNTLEMELAQHGKLYLLFVLYNNSVNVKETIAWTYIERN